MGHDHTDKHGHAPHAGNDSKTKFAVIFALVLFFAVTVAGQMIFVGIEEPAAAEHVSKSDAVDHSADKSDDQADEKPHKALKKKH